MTWLQTRPVKEETRHKIWLVLPLVVISLIMTGFAHRAMPFDSGSDPAADVRQALPDGTVLIFCINGGGGNDDHDDHGDACEFCRIASSSHSLDGLAELEAIRLKPVRILQRKNETVPVQLGSYGNPARAPPIA